MLIFAAVVAPGLVAEREGLIDESLIVRIAQDDREAFCALYEACYSSVFAYALSILRSRDDAEDAAQETFLHIRSAAHLYRSQGKPMAWILTIARNVCLMQFRRRSRETLLPSDELPLSDDLSMIEDREDRMVLEAALRTLSEEECRIIMLHAVSGMKHREIAELFGLPLSTVLSKYKRGLAKLRRDLEVKLA